MVKNNAVQIIVYNTNNTNYCLMYCLFVACRSAPFLWEHQITYILSFLSFYLNNNPVKKFVVMVPWHHSVYSKNRLVLKSETSNSWPALHKTLSLYQWSACSTQIIHVPESSIIFPPPPPKNMQIGVLNNGQTKVPSERKAIGILYLKRKKKKSEKPYQSRDKSGWSGKHQSGSRKETASTEVYFDWVVCFVDTTRIGQRKDKIADELSLLFSLSDEKEGFFQGELLLPKQILFPFSLQEFPEL